MRYLTKKDDSTILAEELSYDTQSQRLRIKELLISEQFGFCAYSERYIKNTDAIDIEHFDGRIKATSDDSYFNWYAVLHWMNAHKPKKLDERFLPLPAPYASNLQQRIRYQGGIFVCNKDDIEAGNLIKYLGFNNPKLVADRKNHVTRITFLRTQMEEGFEDYLATHKEELSFITALEIELELNLNHLL
ncbi:MAG: hypothetical protein ACI976_002938 [Aureispira sp.]|jgi:hypothetical protein